MNRFKLGGAGLLLLVWAVIPGDFLRWTAAAMAFAIGFSALWSWILQRSLVLEPVKNDLRSFSGRSVEVSFRVENRGPLPSGLVFVTDSSGGLEIEGQTRRYVTLAPFSRWRYSYQVHCVQRGRRSLGPLTLSGSDPAGLFRFRKQTKERTLLVYPVVRPLDGWPLSGQPSGPRVWHRAWTDDLSRFRAFRDFMPGDGLSRLSAAAWAKTGFPQVRTFDWTVEQPTVVVLDLRAWTYPLRLRWDLLESAVERAASLLWGLLQRGERVWLSVYDAAPEDPCLLGPGRGWTDAPIFLERLALAVPLADETGSAPWRLPPPPATLYLVGPASAPPEALVPGYHLVRFLMGEGRERGTLAHP